MVWPAAKRECQAGTSSMLTENGKLRRLKARSRCQQALGYDWKRRAAADGGTHQRKKNPRTGKGAGFSIEGSEAM